MCVVLAVPEGSPDISAEEWTQASVTNNDGYGVAWLQDGLVHFRKMLTAKVGTLENWRPPKPYVMHFRLATIGAEEAGMCHPFIVSNNSKLVSRGRAREVLFHNGHWSDWNEWLALTYSGKGRLPAGEYSDSRAMAMMVGHYGAQILDISGAAWSQKIMLFNQRGELTIYGQGWEHNDDGTIRSNTTHLDMWGYDGHGYGAYGHKPGWEEQEYGTSKDANTLVEGICSECAKDFFKYKDEAAEGLCYSCEKDSTVGYRTKENNKKALTPSVLIKTDKHCPTCGYTNTGYTPLHVPNCCPVCKDNSATPVCQGCDTHLYQVLSIASGVCDKCRHDGDFQKADLHANVWTQIAGILKEFSADAYWIPASLMAYRELEDKEPTGQITYHVMGRLNDGPAIFASGSTGPKGTVCTPMSYDPDEREMMGADDKARLQQSI